MSLPYMKFFPSDWRGSTGLKLVSMAARGLWIEMICIMHEAEPYGHLIHNGKILGAKQLAALVGASPSEVEVWLQELLEMDVVKRKRNDVFYSKRMEDDEIKRRRASDHGKKGGRPSADAEREKKPTLKGQEKGDGKDHYHPHEETESRSQNPDTREEPSLRSEDKSQADLLQSAEAVKGPEEGSAAPGTALAVVKVQTKAVSSKGTRLPDDWRPTESDIAYAEEHGFDSRGAWRMAENFRDYWIAIPGQRGLKLNWPATWKKWVRTQAERGGHNGQGSNQPHRDQRNADASIRGAQKLFGFGSEDGDVD